MIQDIEPEISKQSPLLWLALDLLTWSQTIVGIAYYAQDSSWWEEQLEREKKLCEFSLAILKGNLAAINQALGHIKDPNKHSSLFGSFLLAAIVGKHLDVADLLIKAGMCPFESGEGNIPAFNALAVACSYETTVFTRLLLTNGHASVRPARRHSRLGRFEWLPLSLCARSGNREMLELLLDHAFPSEPSNSVLLYFGDSEDVSISDIAAQPLNYAMARALSKGHTDIAQELLERGAKNFPLTRSTFFADRNPIYQIFHRGDKPLLDKLLEHGHHKNIVMNANALIGAASGGQLEMAEWLLNNGFNFRGHTDWNPTEAAVQACLNGHLSMVKFLKSQGIPRHSSDYFTRDHREWKSLNWNCLEAVIFGDHSHILEYMLQTGLLIDKYQDTGIIYTAHLGEACRRGALSCVQMLLKYGAQPNLKVDEEFERPVETAYDNGYYRIARLLLKNGAETTRRDVLSLI
jgi:ankyrin repeat protein